MVDFLSIELHHACISSLEVNVLSKGVPMAIFSVSMEVTLAGSNTARLRRLKPKSL
jgi:hypothetical protein